VSLDGQAAVDRQHLPGDEAGRGRVDEEPDRRHDVVEARDPAAGLRSMIEADAAVGEAFNIGPAAPCSERDFAEHLGRRLGLRVIEIALPLPRRQWRVSSDKARRVLGYDPVHDPLGMIDEAVAQLSVTERRPT
jgi:nucleoside-diphosphate-sugar epimerase